MSQQPYTNLEEECAAPEEQGQPIEKQQPQQQQQHLPQQQQQQLPQQHQIPKQQTPLQQPVIIQRPPQQPAQTTSIQAPGTQFLPGQHLPVQNGQQIIVLNNPQPMRLNVPTKIATSLSITQLVIAILGIIFNIVGICFYCFSNCSGHAIWSGALFIVTASLGIATGRNKGLCLTITSMILNIVSSVFAGLVIILASVGIAHAADELSWNDWEETEIEVAMVMDSLLILCGITIMVTAIVLAIIFGKAGCGRQAQYPGTVHYQPSMQMAPVQGMQQVRMSSGNQQVAAQPTQVHQMPVQSNQAMQTYPIMVPQGNMAQGQNGQPFVYASGPPAYAPT